MGTEKSAAHWKIALAVIVPALNANKIAYKIVGGTVAALHGVVEQVKDIDIELSAEDAYRFQTLFHEFIMASVTLSDNGEHRSHFGQFEIEGVGIDIMGDLHRRAGDGWIPSYTLTQATVALNGIAINAPWLEEETLAYIRRGKLDRAGLCLPYCDHSRLLALLQGKVPTHVI